MSKPLKIIVSAFLSFAILFNILPVFSFAEDYTSDYGAQTNWWNCWLHNASQRVDGFTFSGIPVGNILKTTLSRLCKQVCEFSDDHWHHADDTDKLSVTDNGDGTYDVTCKCMYCHKKFVAKNVTPEDVSETYSDYVDTLPAQGINSANKVLWQPKWVDDTLDGCWGIYIIHEETGGKVTYFLDPTSGNPVVNDVDYTALSFSGSNIVVTCSLQKVFSLKFYNAATANTTHRFSVPIAGRYECVTPMSVFCHYSVRTDQYEKEFNFSSPASSILYPGDKVYATNYRSNSNKTFKTVPNIDKGIFVVSAPIYSIEPSDTSIVADNFLSGTRVNNFYGDYYDSVTNNYYENCTFVNETTNIYHDPSTGTDHTMQNWSYDYRSRTYFITLEDGTTVTVQFGDDCLTITNNNSTNSYQYVIKNNGSTPETPAGCKHDWKETVDKAPTCLEGGHASFTCSKCNETYEQLLAAKGHNWTVKEHVNTVYNEDGTLATQGHTLYECSVCGEQWYTDSAAPPPDTSGSSSVLSWLQSFKTWLEEKLDITPLLDRLDSILEALQAIPGSTACEHNYEQHTEQEADCTLPGLIIFTCSECGDSYSEVVDPLGHDWIISDHVDAVTDPETGEVTASAYDIYTCSRCSRTYEDHTAGGAPSEDYNDSLISQLVVKVFSKLGTFAGKLIGFVVNLFSKAISSVDELITRFNAYVEQIGSFGGGYPTWLSGFWLVLPTELQIALTFGFLCIVLGMVGKKLFFS